MMKTWLSVRLIATARCMATGVMCLMIFSAQASEPRVLAAGSLRLAVTELLEAYESDQGVGFESLFGPSGKLRQLIEDGESFSLFLSASKQHTDALLDQGLVRNSEPFTRNALCLMAAPGMTVEPDDVVDVLLDPAVRLGTSTPKADPSGDYTWEMFRKIDEQRPGSFDTLDAKALKLTGGQVDRDRKGLPYADVFKKDEADVFVSYCTNAVATAGEVNGLTWVRIPDGINVAAQYGLALAPDASVESQELAAFIQGPRGREILARYGFQ